MDTSDMQEELLDAWRAHNDLNLFLLAAIPEEGLGAVTLLKTGKPSRGRGVAKQFAHMHWVRVEWSARTSEELAAGVPRLGKDAEPEREELAAALAASGSAVERAFRWAVDSGRGIRGFRRSPVSWLCYLISHESHHRGNIMLALKQSGFRLPDEVRYGLWNHWHGTPVV